MARRALVFATCARFAGTAPPDGAPAAVVAPRCPRGAWRRLHMADAAIAAIEVVGDPAPPQAVEMCLWERAADAAAAS